MRRGWRWPLAGVAGLMVAVSLFVIPALGDGPVTADVGTLRLQLNSAGDKFIYDPDAAGPNLEQRLSSSNCRLSSTGPAVLVAVGAVDPNTSDNRVPYPGLKDHRIGVGQTGEGNGEPCARINQSLSQTLTLSLAGVLEGTAIDYAEIDLGFKFNGDAVLELSRDGSTPEIVTIPCNAESDCGPDSGGNDNLLVILDGRPSPAAGAIDIHGPFDTITISSSTAGGSVSLEGGLGGTGDSEFHIVEAFDGEIDCTETETLEGEDATFEITRGNDLDGGCKGPPDGLLYSFDTGTESDELFIHFVTEPVDTNADTVAQFLEVITWRFDGPPDVPGGEEQLRVLSYDDDVTVAPPKQVMPWCLKDPRDGSGDLPVGTVTEPFDPYDPDDPVLPTGHTSCLIESRSYVTGLLDILDYPLGTFVKVDVVYNIGDGKRWT